MHRNYSDLFFNTVFLSLPLSALFAAAVTTWTPDADLLFGWSFTFLAIFLMVYFYNLIVSLVFFVTASLCSHSVVRIILFLITGLLALSLLVYRTDSLPLFSLYTSFILMSAASVIRTLPRSP